MYNDEMRDHNHEVFNTFFQDQDDWIMEYVQSDDYMNEYAFLIFEGDQLDRSISELLKEDRFQHSFSSAREICGIPKQASLPHELNDYIIEAIQYYNLFEVHCVNEHALTCNGYLDSYQIEEYENQIEVDRIKESVLFLLKFPDDTTDFENLLAEYIDTERNHCLRGTLAELQCEHACMHQYVDTGLRIEFYLTSEQMEQVTTHGMIAYCKHVDRNRKERLSVESKNVSTDIG